MTNLMQPDLEGKIEIVEGSSVYLLKSNLAYDKNKGTFIMFNEIDFNPPKTFWQKLKRLFKRKEKKE